MIQITPINNQRGGISILLVFLCSILCNLRGRHDQTTHTNKTKQNNQSKNIIGDNGIDAQVKGGDDDSSTQDSSCISFPTLLKELLFLSFEKRERKKKEKKHFELCPG
jgi:hypothetical protein